MATDCSSRNLPTLSSPAPAHGAIASLSVVLACLAVGLFAVTLNRMVYQHRQPIYDSMSYYSKLHRVMSTARYEGVGAAAAQTCRGSNTVALPFLIAALLGKMLEPDRAIGVWIQIGQLLLLASLLVRYWRTVQGMRWSESVLLTLPFLGLACLYDDQGGLSDFRMDLGLMLMFGGTCVAYLIAHHTRRPSDYWLLGIVAGATLLCRATAPAYLLLALGPLVLVDGWRGRRWRQDASLLARSLLAAGLVGGWFYLLNYDYLHYYYVVWNTDANARLPWSSSIRHGEFVLKHIGMAAGIWWVSAALIVRWPRRLPRREVNSVAPVAPAGDGRLLWLGLAPLAGLVVGGAGHNPFVSMPAALGLFLALVAPLAHRLAGQPEAWRRRALLAATVGCLLLAAARGYSRHQPDRYRSMDSHRTLLNTLIQDAQRQGITAASYGALHLNQMDATSLQNVLLFDMPQCETRVAATICDGVQLMPNLTFFRPAAADWQEIPGGNDSEKIESLVSQAAAQIDYLVVPEPDSVRQISERLPHFIGNRHLAAIRARIVESGDWRPLSAPLVVGPLETVRLWGNLRRRTPSR